MSTKSNSAPPPIEPLALTTSPTTGSLLTSPLSTVFSVTLSSLYQDLHDMTHGEISVVTKHSTEQQQQSEEVSDALTLSTEKMSSLPFSQRRFELSCRLARHARSISHCCALLNYDSNIATDCSNALQHVHSAWIRADEAQDSLFFAHSKLYFGRKWSHDVDGAMQLISSGKWVDFPKDVELVVDPFEISKERGWSEEELEARLQCCVRKKLVEGWCGKGMWERVILEKGGGVVRLVYGEDKDENRSNIEARVTVLSEQDEAEWTLLSLHINVNPKTGESCHQLELNNRQRFDLHRLCARSMAVEEAKARKSRKENSESTIVAKPLDSLFEVSHTFATSLQLEILSAQADALKRGAWSDIQISPIRYLDSKFACSEDEVSAIMAIHFWSCDDRFGAPLISDLNFPASPYENQFPLKTKLTNRPSQKLSLCIRSIPRRGIIVSISGGSNVTQTDPFLKRNLDKLLSSIQNPFCLSVSDALLASTLICSQMRCDAVVAALSPTLPSWMALSLDCGTISVGIRVSYGNREKRLFVTVFRLAVDSRTGKFISVFPPSSDLLKNLACNDPSVSPLFQFRLASSKQQRRSNLTGRLVRDAFEGLHRSFNILGSRVGVGGIWEDAETDSDSLRKKVIQEAVADVKSSLWACCGISALFGLAAQSLGVVLGINAVVDMAGGVMDNITNVISVPPLAVVLNQETVRTSVKKDDEMKSIFYLKRNVLAAAASVDSQQVCLHFFEVETKADAPYSVPERITYQLFDIVSKELSSSQEDEQPLNKKPRLGDIEQSPVLEEVQYLCDLLSKALGKHY